MERSEERDLFWLKRRVSSVHGWMSGRSFDERVGDCEGEDVVQNAELGLLHDALSRILEAE